MFPKEKVLSPSAEDVYKRQVLPCAYVLTLTKKYAFTIFQAFWGTF